jgi:hypothetical protein
MNGLTRLPVTLGILSNHLSAYMYISYNRENIPALLPLIPESPSRQI